MPHPVRVAPILALALAAGCFSSSPASAPDASFDGSFSDATFGDDASPGTDAGPDATPEAGADATTFDAATDTGATETGTADASHDATTEAGPADGSSHDASDAADAALGGGTVSSSASLKLTSFRQGHTATRLANGNVLFCGGLQVGQSALSSCDLFDPGDASAVLGTFSLVAAQLGLPRAQPAAVVLQNGSVLALGGAQTANDDTAEVADSGLGAFAPTANTMSASRNLPSAAVLPDGRVFVIGGGGLVSTADIYDPATGSFTSVTLPEPSTYQTAVTLQSGHVMISEGRNASGDTGTIYVFDPATGNFATASGTLNPPRVLTTATLLADGRVIIAGGQSAQGFIVPNVDIFTE